MNLIPAFRLQLRPSHADVVAFVGAGGKTSTLFRLADEVAATGHRVVTTTTTRIFASQVAQSSAHLTIKGGDVDWRRLERLLDEHGQCLLVTDVAGEKAAGVDPRIVDRVADRAADLDIAIIAVEADGSRRRPVKAPAAHEPVIPDSTTLLVPVLGLDGVGVRLEEPFVHRPQQIRSVLGTAQPVRLTPAMATRLLLDPRGGIKGKPSTARLLPLLNKAETAPRLAAGRLIAHLLAERGQASLIGAVGQTGQAPIRERWGSMVAVVLAAGESSRMGRAKQLLAIDGVTLVERAVQTALDSNATQVIVVTGAHADRVEAALVSPVQSQGDRLRLVHNADWASGQASSVLAALRALPAAWEAVLFLPVDQPALPPSLLRRLWRLWREGRDLAAPSVDGEVRGAPAVFDRRYQNALSAVQGDRGAGPILKRNQANVATIPVPASCLADVDTPEAWADFQS